MLLSSAAAYGIARGWPQKLLRSLSTRFGTRIALVGAGVVVVTTYIMRRKWHVVRGLMLEGPYPPATSNRTIRLAQRAIINLTRKNRSVTMYPLEFLIEQRPVRTQDNGHPVCGAVRDAGRELIESAVSAGGFTKCELSPASQARPCDGGMFHQHYAPADLRLGVSNEPPGERAVIVCIDTDYYLSDPGFILQYGRPVLLHTFQPTTPSGMDGESRFRVVDDTVLYEVSGGGGWHHQVWDWCTFGEFIQTPVPRTRSLKHLLLSAVGLRETMLHKVAFARPWTNCPHRALVWCLPEASFWSWGVLPAEISARQLKRVQFTDPQRPGWNRIVSITDNSAVQVSFGRAGEDAFVTLPKTEYDVLMGLSSGASVTTRLINMGYTDAITLGLTGQHYAGKPAPVDEPCRLARPVAMTHWPTTSRADAPEIVARAYATPLVPHPSLMPMTKRLETTSLSIDRRITITKNTKVPPRAFQSLAAEFVAQVVPVGGCGSPYTWEDAAPMLDKPTQQLGIKAIWDTADVPPRELIEAFIKNEPTAKCSRIISSFPDMRFLLGFARYTMKFRDEVLHAEHNRHWFMPGRTPAEIATAVCDYCSRITQPLSWDFSNFDGSISEWLQSNVMNAVYHRYFGDSRELRQYTRMLITCPARSKRFGFAYEAGCGVKSGSPTTCDLNTVASAFVQYCAIRMSCPDTTPSVAFASIGLAFGDDSLFDRRYQRRMNTISDCLGLSGKPEPSDPELGVVFLARVFPAPTETTTSFQDPMRTWMKLHLTNRDPTIPLADAAVDRVEGYLLTDRCTPLTSHYCAYVLNCYREACSPAFARAKRRCWGREKPYWLTGDGSWPQDPKDVELMEHCIAARVGLSVEQLRDHIALIKRLTPTRDPWHELTLPGLRDQSMPYKDTLDPVDQLPVAPVDLRNQRSDEQHANEREQISNRRTVPNPDSSRGRNTGRRDRPDERPRGHNARPSQLSRMHPVSGRESQSRDSEPAGETARRGVPARNRRRRRVQTRRERPAQQVEEPAVAGERSAAGDRSDLSGGR